MSGIERCDEILALIESALEECAPAEVAPSAGMAPGPLRGLDDTPRRATPRPLVSAFDPWL